MVSVEATHDRGGESFLAGAGRSAAQAWGRVPPPAMVMIGILSVQLGAAVAKQLFAVTGPSGAVALRLVFSGVIMVAFLRPTLRLDRKAMLTVVAYGLALAFMNISFYQAIARIPLGVTVTIEFLGPLTVAVLGSRRWSHGLWALLAAGGVVLLTDGGGSDMNWLGVVFALCAALGWGTYIHLAAALGKHTSGSTGLALSMAIAGLVAAPVGLVESGGALFGTTALLAGLGVAVMSSVIPYSVELEALRRIPPRVFGILMSLEPAVASLIGLLVLNEHLEIVQWAAVACVVAASIGSTRGS